MAPSCAFREAPCRGCVHTALASYEERRSTSAIHQRGSNSREFGSRQRTASLCSQSETTL